VTATAIEPTCDGLCVTSADIGVPRYDQEDRDVSDYEIREV
jgi:hypothetical protein